MGFVDKNAVVTAIRNLIDDGEVYAISMDDDLDRNVVAIEVDPDGHVKLIVEEVR